MVQDEFATHGKFVALHIEFVVEVCVEGVVQQGLEAVGSSFFTNADLWTGGTPLFFNRIYVALTYSSRTDGLAHLLLEGGDHMLLGWHGEFYAGDIQEAAFFHVLYDIVVDSDFIRVDGTDALPFLLEAFDVADDGTVDISRG